MASENQGTIYYDYDGLGASRTEGDWNVTVVMPGGATRRVDELARFMNEAYRVDKTEYDKLVAEALRG